MKKVLLAVIMVLCFTATSFANGGGFIVQGQTEPALLEGQVIVLSGSTVVAAQGGAIIGANVDYKSFDMEKSCWRSSFESTSLDISTGSQYQMMSGAGHQTQILGAGYLQCQSIVADGLKIKQSAGAVSFGYQSQSGSRSHHYNNPQ